MQSTCDNSEVQECISNSLIKLDRWLVNHSFMAYDPFDGLSSWLRPLTLERKLFRQILLQTIKRTPAHVRPLLGIKPSRSSKGLAYISRGDMLLYKRTGEEKYFERASTFLRWLQEHSCPDYEGCSWGNHFDYQSRSFYLQKNQPTLVWTSLVGKAFAEAYKLTGNAEYANIVRRTCDFILTEIPHYKQHKGVCISYIVTIPTFVHNANLLGASMLAHGYSIFKDHRYLELARSAVEYSAACQLSDGGWFYGEQSNLHWIDNWHTGYNLDSIFHYQKLTGDDDFEEVMRRGLKYYKTNFFSNNAIPKFYNNSLYPIDIQSIAQSIDTLVLFRAWEQDGLQLAKNIAIWATNNMQSSDGHFYFQKRKSYTNRIPFLHWGQGTMYHALSNLLSNL